MSKMLSDLLRKSTSVYHDLWIAQSRQSFATEPKDSVIEQHLAYWQTIVDAVDSEEYDALVTSARQAGEYQCSIGLDISTAVRRTVEATNLIEIALLEATGDASPLEVISEIADLRSMLVMGVVAGYNDALGKAEKNKPAAMVRDRLRSALQANPKKYPVLELKQREEIGPLYDEEMRLYAVEEGKVRVFNLLPTGRTVTLSIVGAGDAFIQWRASASSLSCICAEAMQNSLVVRVAERDVVDLVSAQPGATVEAIVNFARRLTESSVLIKDLMDNSVNLRLYRTLLELAREHGQAPSNGGGVLIDIPLTHQRLADMVGSNRVTVTRKLLELQKRGLIAGRGSGSIEILDLEALQRLTAQPQS